MSVAELFIKLQILAHRLQYLGDLELKKDGLTTKQTLIIITIAKFFTKTAPSINDICKVMYTSHQNVKKLVDQLVRKGFLKIARDQKDKRIIRVYTTLKNDEFWEKQQKNHDKFIESLFSNLEVEDIEKFNQLSDNSLSHLDTIVYLNKKKGTDL